MKYIIICLIILLAVVPVEASTVELTLGPAKSLEQGHKYRLLVEADEQSDTDAALLYEKALQLLPGSLKMDEIDQWLKTRPDELPKKQVQSVLEQLKPAFKLIEQAAKCKQCDWQYLDDDTLSQTLADYRKLIFLLALQVRLQIAQDSYDEAINTFQIGFGMARHLGEDTVLVRGMVGIGMAAYMCRQIEQFVQRPDAPSLYHALRDLPQPMIDLTRQAEWEEPDIKGKVGLLMKRLDRHIAVLQCIEAIRLYAGSHDGMFPGKLLDVKEVEVPKDVMNDKEFEYRRTSTGAVLKSAMPEGGRPKDIIHYEIVFKK